MKKYLLLLIFTYAICGTAQELRLKKGIIIDSVPVNDSIPEGFVLYLPTNFDASKNWPVIFVFDLEGRGKQALSMFRAAAEEEGYVLAASNNVHDSLSISRNVLISSRMMNSLNAILPIESSKIYTAGFLNGGRFASLLPTFIKNINGVVSCGSPIASIEVLDAKRPFHFIGIVGNEDFNYIEILNNQKALNKLGFLNQFLFFDGGQEWPESKYIAKAMRMLALSAMNQGIDSKDDTFIDDAYEKNLANVGALISSKKPLQAHQELFNMLSIYKGSEKVDSLKEKAKSLRKTQEYKSHSRNQNSAFLKENFLKEDYIYLLEEDILTYNYNNLGWWKFQMEELAEYDTMTKNRFEKQMAKRLSGYLNALIADNTDLVKSDANVDEEALNFLWMLSTITTPKNYSPYLKVISFNAKVEDYSTALFYVEELLKNGYTNKTELYALENTALLRITPEFNKIVSKYLNDARYDIIDE